MDKDTALEAVRAFGAELAKLGVRPGKVVLYGSFARGDWHEWSDIDVVVVSPDFAGMEYGRRIEVTAEAIYRVYEPIEAVAMTPAEWERGDSTIARFAREGEEVRTTPTGPQAGQEKEQQ